MNVLLYACSEGLLVMISTEEDKLSFEPTFTIPELVKYDVILFSLIIVILCTG